MIPNEPQKCPLCGNAGGYAVHHALEMNFGTREAFDYAECAGCGSLFLLDPPADMKKYYPDDYYSFQQMARLHYPWWMRVLKRARARYEMTGRGMLGRWVAGRQGVWPYYRWFKEAGVGLHASILDVGCGKGDYLLRFRSEGFTNLTGVDPFIGADIEHEGGVKIFCRDVAEMTGTFECVLAMDSVEHMADPVKSLGDMQRLVVPGGVCLVAIPVAGCQAWEEYGVNWYQLDAPRHLSIPSVKAMGMLAQGAGFILEKILFDSKEDQFMISEAYKRGVSIKELWSPGNTLVFTEAERREFQRKAAAANESGRGDHACFVLRKSKQH